LIALVSITGPVVSTVKAWAALVPVLAPASDWLTVAV
jgi:hypothetical protein